MFMKSAVTAIIITIAASGAVAARDANSAPVRNAHAAYAAGGLSTADGYLVGQPYQGTPMDRLSIWRRGSYLGNDPDPLIRLNLMRDGRGRAY